jgi:hypothetical protein
VSAVSIKLDTDSDLWREMESLAKPFVDREPLDVIRRAIAVLRQQQPHPQQEKQAPKRAAPIADPDVFEFDGNQPPNLTFARLLSVLVDNQRARARWNHLLKDMVDKLPPDSDFESLVRVNFARGEPPTDGFNHCPNAGVSIQYQDANHAWRAVAEIAKHLGISVVAEVQWDQKRPGKTAPAYPGKRGRLVIQSK